MTVSAKFTNKPLRFSVLSASRDRMVGWLCRLHLPDRPAILRTLARKNRRHFALWQTTLMVKLVPWNVTFCSGGSRHVPGSQTPFSLNPDPDPNKGDISFIYYYLCCNLLPLCPPSTFNSSLFFTASNIREKCPGSFQDPAVLCSGSERIFTDFHRVHITPLKKNTQYKTLSRGPSPAVPGSVIAPRFFSGIEV